MDIGLGETLGVEEEFHLLDAAGNLLPAADRVIAADDRDDVEPELMSTSVETASVVCGHIDEVHAAVRQTRRSVIEAATAAGARVLTAGTVPSRLPEQAVTYPKARYEHMVENYGEVGRQQIVCSTQWHVGVPDRDEAVRLASAIRRWLPPLLALSASSPWFDGRDTGYASYRRQIWCRWPTAGVFESFHTAAEYDETVSALLESGVASDPGMIYFDARPSARFPTLEIRVADGCPLLADVVTLAGLAQGLVLALAADGEPDVRTEVLRAATWTAARHGLSGTLLDPVTHRPVPAADAVGRTLDRARPALDRIGTTDQVSRGLEAILASGGSAVRQRAAGDVGGVIDLLVEETARGVAPGGPDGEVGG